MAPELPNPLTSQDIQNFIHSPEGEIDTFALMAGNIVGTFSIFNTLTPENQLIVFDHLLSYTWCCYFELNDKWRRTTHENAEKIVGERMLAEQFPNSRETVETLENLQTSTHTFNAQLTRAHSTIFDMFAERTLTVKEKNAQKSNTSSRRKNAPDTIPPGKNFHTKPTHFSNSRLMDALSSE